MPHDIYDPPPAPVHLAPPPAEPVTWTTADLAILVCLCSVVAAGSAWAWTVEPAMGVLCLGGGLLVILESWFSALTFLHRRPWVSLSARWRVFLAALVPWGVGLGLAAALMLALFSLSDWAG